jgi:hypothetical protein
VARRCPLTHRRPSRASPRQTVALGLAAAASGHRGARGLTHRTIDRVAKDLGEDVDFLFDVAVEMEPEDGLIWVLSLGDESVMAFTDDGVDSLVELIKIHRETKPREER